MPPLAGPRARLCWTRYPVNTFVLPSSICTGKLLASSLLQLPSTSRRPWSRFSLSAAAWNGARAGSSGPASALAVTLGIAIGYHLTFVTRGLGAENPRPLAHRLALAPAILPQPA